MIEKTALEKFKELTDNDKANPMSDLSLVKKWTEIENLSARSPRGGFGLQYPAVMAMRAEFLSYWNERILCAKRAAPDTTKNLHILSPHKGAL